ncbi:MAG: glycerol kinase GlpK [Spirochaetales bacterium]|nr:MAG: glycerol kinase GlpK [Spirochaetales bacterium]
MKQYILSIDQGTTSTRALLVTKDGSIAASAQRETTQFYPEPGWVEQDAGEIWTSVVEVIGEALEKLGINGSSLAAIGIANQRETSIVWNRRTGEPLGKAIVWQCRRTASLCAALKDRGLENIVRETTGLPVDAYFSATKFRWLLDNLPGAAGLAEKGLLAAGTVDSWLLWNLTGGGVHATDATNASRTMLFDINKLAWSGELCREIGVPPQILPEVRPSLGLFGMASHPVFGGREVPVTGMAGDQQAALFGQCCFSPGMAKNTYGTGCFLMMNTGPEPKFSDRGLITTLAAGGTITAGTMAGNKPVYALEGSIFTAGAVVSWLRDGLGIIKTSAETETLALAAESNGGVYLVPAFSGLGTPYWDMYARGTILGITGGTKREHLVRAALESMAYQTRDVLDILQETAGIPLAELRVDGGASGNRFLLQFQADIIGRPVLKPESAETTALGAAYLAGLAAGFWSSLEDVNSLWKPSEKVEPSMEPEKAAALYRNWQRAVERARNWIEPSA